MKIIWCLIILGNMFVLGVYSAITFNVGINKVTTLDWTISIILILIGILFILDREK